MLASPPSCFSHSRSLTLVNWRILDLVRVGHVLIQARKQRAWFRFTKLKRALNSTYANICLSSVRYIAAVKTWIFNPLNALRYHGIYIHLKIKILVDIFNIFLCDGKLFVNGVKLWINRLGREKDAGIQHNYKALQGECNDQRAILYYILIATWGVINWRRQG